MVLIFNLVLLAKFFKITIVDSGSVNVILLDLSGFIIV